jgi:predicted nuclease of predicted toxin-antitoxin system
MLRLVSDENFNGEIVRGLLRRQPDLDLVRIQDVGLLGAEDPAILAWAASEGRVLLTHDRRTIPSFAYERTRQGEPMTGVFLVDDQAPVGQMIEELLVATLCSSPEEWRGQVLFFPL